MRHDVYPLPYTARQQTTTATLNLHEPDDLELKKFSFLWLATKSNLYSNCNLRQRLLMVGPAPGEWNLLRATDGERFVVNYKNNGFPGELLIAKIERAIRSSQFED